MTPEPDGGAEAAIDSGGFLRSVVRTGGGTRGYPWSIPAIRSLTSLKLHPRVTFIVGENGAGKSTLIEALAQVSGFDEQGGSRNFNNLAREYWSELGGALQPIRGPRREKDSFFLRAESFYNVATKIEELGISLKYYGGRSPHQQSHGESFLALAANRFAGEGLYILDEPEAALSPSRQLAFLRILHAQVQELGSQFIIATHSPLIMAYPEALLYYLDDSGMRTVTYEETEHYTLTRDFLANPQRYLRHLLGDL
jgi:predicted ATPase